MPENQVIDMALWGDRAASPAERRMYDSAITYDEGLKPVAIAVSANDIGKLYHDGASPFVFTQFLLERFKAAGVRVEGSVKMKLASGEVYKVKDQGPSEWFRYVWLPPAYVQGLKDRPDPGFDAFYRGGL
jgi:hypothetical protein